MTQKKIRKAYTRNWVLDIEFPQCSESKRIDADLKFAIGF